MSILIVFTHLDKLSRQIANPNKPGSPWNIRYWLRAMKITRNYFLRGDVFCGSAFPLKRPKPLVGLFLGCVGKFGLVAGFAPGALRLWSAERRAPIGGEDEVFAPAIAFDGRGKIGCGGRI